MLRRRRLVVLLLLVVVLPVGVGYRTLCAGPASAYTAMVSARDEARGERAAVPAGDGLFGVARAGAAGAWAAALDGALAWKQDDRVAFPAHVAAGYAVELGPCSAEARADQWRKAAKHAWGPDQAGLAAAGLRRTFGADAALETLRGDAKLEPWFTPNLDRVAARLNPSTG